MRYQGRITTWNDDRGFGFITPNDGGAKVFLHISALQAGQRRPVCDEIVTYEMVNDAEKRPSAQHVAHFQKRGVSVEETKRFGWKPILMAFLLGAIAVYAWQGSSVVQPLPISSADLPPHTDRVFEAAAAPAFRCAGKHYCSEMTSCEEARFYLKNCPGTEMDGDRDGIPCESQWCTR